MTSPRSETIAAWTALVSTSNTLLAGVESALKAEGLPKLAWYDVLLEIEKAGTNGIRPFELKEKLLLPQYGLSRVLERMAKADLIVRRDVEEDGRGQTIELTTKGRKIRSDMWPVYAGALTNFLEQRVDPDEALELTRILKKLSHL